MDQVNITKLNIALRKLREAADEDTAGWTFYELTGKASGEIMEVLEAEIPKELLPLLKLERAVGVMERNAYRSDEWE